MSKGGEALYPSTLAILLFNQPSRVNGVYDPLATAQNEPERNFLIRLLNGKVGVHR